MKIEIFGTGCPKCKKLTENAQKAANDLGVEAEIVKVQDINEIMKRGIMLTPAIAVNENVKSSGRIPDVDEIKKWLGENKEK